MQGRDERLDLAVLELVGAKDLPFASLGSSDALRVGEYVVAIGNPFGLGHTVTMGIVSAKARAIGAGPYDDFIQTDASINPGNSGGPLFNLHGQVVGINTAINPAGQGIGFAIPIDALKDVLPQLLAIGQVARGRLGVAIQPVDATLAKALGLPTPTGALVATSSRAARRREAGLKPGDVIVGVDGAPVEHGARPAAAIARRKPGTKRDARGDGQEGPANRQRRPRRDEGRRASAVRTAGAAADARREARRSASRSPTIRGSASWSPTWIRRARGGLLDAGDVIVEVDGAPVKTAREAADRIKQAPLDRPILLRVRREGRTRFVAIERKS